MQNLAWLALAGAIGTLARFWLSALVQRLCGDSFPWGTLSVNVIGCFLFGLVWTWAEERHLLSSQTRLVVLTGFMGAFTTFSTFAFETGDALRNALLWKAAVNVLAQNVVGILAVFLGFVLGRSLPFP